MEELLTDEKSKDIGEPFWLGKKGNPVWITPNAVRVLVVDDDPSFLKIITRIAKKFKLAVTQCRSLDELGALQMGKFDFAIVDYDLGSINGIAVIKYLERYLGKLPVILVSQSLDIDTPSSSWPGSVKAFMHKSLGHQAILESAIAAFKGVQPAH